MGILNAAEKKELKQLYEGNNGNNLFSFFYKTIIEKLKIFGAYKVNTAFLVFRNNKKENGELPFDIGGKAIAFTKVPRVENYYNMLAAVSMGLGWDIFSGLIYKFDNAWSYFYTLTNDYNKCMLYSWKKISPVLDSPKSNFYTFEEYLEAFEKILEDVIYEIKKYLYNLQRENSNKKLEQQANGASALQVKSNPENVVFCFGKTPKGFNLKEYNYNVYKGWHEDGKACMLRYRFSEPIILTDNKNASGVLALSKKFGGKVLTYDEFLNGDKTVTDTFESIAKQYSDKAYNYIKGNGTLESKKYPNSFANLSKDKDNYILTETCFAGNQKGLFKVKYVIVDNQGFDNEFGGVAKTRFYGANDKPLITLDQFGSVVETLVKDARQKALYAKEDWDN